MEQIKLVQEKLSVFKKVILIINIMFFQFVFANENNSNVPSNIFYYTQALCYEYDLDFNLCLAILKTENTSFNQKAVNENSNGTVDCGLWQLNSKYLESAFFIYLKENQKNVFDWRQNTYMALNHIKFLTSKLNTQEEIICAYNCGIGAVRKNQIPQSTKLYLKKVQKYYKELENETN